MDRRDSLKLLAAGASSALFPRPAWAQEAASTLPLTFDVGVVPWSRFGSYLTLSSLVRERLRDEVQPGLYLHDLSGSRLWDWNGVFRLEPLAGGDPVSFETTAQPASLRLSSAAGSIEACFEDASTLRLRGQGLGLRFAMAVEDSDSLVIPVNERQWRLQMGAHAHFALSAITGSLSVSGPRARRDIAGDIPVEALLTPDASGGWEAALEIYESGWKPRHHDTPFDRCRERVEQEFAAYLAQLPQAPERYAAARALAGYIHWSFVVAARGELPRAAVLMSKNWMHALWSWDNCFNALALARARPNLAWDQFMIPFDLQHPQGALPDVMNDRWLLWSFVKPPIHGWTLRKLMAAGVTDQRRLGEIYPKLARWTEWWLSYRDDDGDGFPEYLHGNDSGWDNATAFDRGFPAEGPDLAAFLAVQMDVLGDVADRLGKPSEASQWRLRAQALLQKLLAELWDGERFRVVTAREGESNPESRSLVPFLPLVLGKRLPADVRQKMIADFSGSGLLTDHGPASESPTSALYEPEGYWRGPIWAPTTYLLADGLTACGERELAVETARRFADMCAKSGFSENYEATTGRALDDPAYSWTASVFLLLTSEYL